MGECVRASSPPWKAFLPSSLSIFAPVLTLSRCTPGRGRRHRQAGSLRIHMNSVHNGIKDYKCEYCGKTLSKLQSLQGHIKAVHHKIKDLKCGTCGKMFSHSSALQKHVQDVHLGIRKCTCNICGREYSKPDSLRMHIKHVHDKIRYVIVF